VELSDWHMWWKHKGNRDLHLLLMEWWDPIGVKGIPEAQNEYDGYSGRLARMLREGASKDELAEFLGAAEVGMGLTPNPDLDELVATKLVDWYREEMRES
jgi:hypothetical protein